MTFLAQKPAGTLAGAREISEAERIPMPFLWKILQKLTRRRLVRSFRGVGGGYELAKPASRIPLHALVMATDGDDLIRDCVLGLPHCNEENRCPLHETWKQIRGQVATMLEQTTVADLARVATRRSHPTRATLAASIERAQIRRAEPGLPR